MTALASLGLGRSCGVDLTVTRGGRPVGHPVGALLGAHVGGDEILEWVTQCFVPQPQVHCT